MEFELVSEWDHCFGGEDSRPFTQAPLGSARPEQKALLIPEEEQAPRYQAASPSF